MTTTVDPIVAALEQQLGCYRKLAKLAELQHRYVQQSQTEELLGVLQSRQAVLDQISDLEQTVGPARGRMVQYLSGLPTELRAIAEKYVAETKRLLEEITTSDRNDALILQQRKLNLGKQLTQVRNARQINRRYATAAYGIPRRGMDIRS
jgi:hypothetical protein